MNILKSEIEGLGDRIAAALQDHLSEGWSSTGAKGGFLKL